jgi:hypothetical protein
MLLMSITASQAQNALYNNGASLFVHSNATLYVNGNIQNNSGSTITNNGTINLKGNITNDATMAAPNAGTLSFQGSTLQNVNGSATYFAENVLVNNSNGVVLNTPLKVDGNTDFTNGIVVASSSNPLIFTANGTHSNASDASHVNGYVVKEGTGSFDYPVGNGTSYQKVSANLSANSTGMQASYSASDAGLGTYTSGGSDPTLLQAYNDLEHWDLTPIGTATGTVTMYWDAINNVGIGDVADLKVAHLSGGNWLNEGGTGSGSIASGSVTSNTVSTWSPYTLGSINKGSSPLPVTLISFTGRAQDKINLLQWISSSEQNNKGFNVQHSLNDKDFTTLGFVAGNGTSNTQHNYNFTHNKPFAGNNYYRLQQLDNDGKITYSKVITINNKNGIITAQPNPSEGIFVLQGLNTEEMQMQVLDITGKTVNAQIQGNKIDVSKQAIGIYYVQIVQNGQVVCDLKLIKTQK